MGLFSRQTRFQKATATVVKHSNTIAAVSMGIIAADIVLGWVGKGYDVAVKGYAWAGQKLEARKANKAA